MRSENYRSLEDTIGYRFRDPELLAAALTHSSYSNEKKSKGVDVECNERLEFLGDSVLSIITSTYLYGEYENFREGDLTKTRAAVVCEKALSKYAGMIGLGKYIFLGHGEEMNRGRERASITADAFEALLAAVYIDSGFDIDAVRAIVLPFIKEEIEAIRTGSSFEDCKTALQHIVQQVNSEKLEYVLVGESGPDHDKVFEVEARLNSNVIGRGRARSKREAEQLAAKEALRLFGEK
ncbi:MAG: ribonuclease III [Clostridia bacterium]|nr:ribonuclease III [Clostridia bacterium]